MPEVDQEEEGLSEEGREGGGGDDAKNGEGK